MKILNPIYARTFAKDLADELTKESVQKIKHSHLLNVHKALEQENLVFPGHNRHKLGRAQQLVYQTLVDKGARIGRAKAFKCASMVLTDRFPHKRKPMWVNLADAENESLLQGDGLPDEFWCGVQWIPWMQSSAQEVIDACQKWLAPIERNPLARQAMNDWQVVQAEEEVQSLYLQFYFDKQLVLSNAWGQRRIADHQALLDQMHSIKDRFDQHFDVLRRTDNGLFASSDFAVQVAREEELLEVKKNARLKIRLATSLGENLYPQDAFAMKKASMQEVFSVLENSNLKIALQLEDPDSSFEVRPK